MKTFQTRAALAALVLALLLPAGALAAPSQTTAHSYTTSMSDWAYGGSAYPYVGKLKLQIQSDGTINGWFSNSDTLSFIPVIGGQNSHYIWLEIGEMGSLHVNAKWQDGKLVGTANEGTRIFDFTASPVT